MRKELEQIEEIEQYLKDELSAAERVSFENELSTNPTLQSHVNFQSDLVSNLQRIGLRSSTQSAYKKYLIKKFALISAAVIGVLTFITIATIYFSSSTNSPKDGSTDEFGTDVESVISTEWETPKVVSDSLYEDDDSSSILIDEIDSISMEAFQPEIAPHQSIYLPENDPLFAEANELLNQELFEINTMRDTVIESENGIVIYIPANAFDTQSREVDFILQEAMTPAAIMYSGLNTMTESGEELETGGMFYLDAFANGKRVDLVKKLTVDIPSDPTKTGMQLYEGAKDEAGQILWKNPQDFTKPLLPVEITSLDFYPPGYEKQMNDWGYLNKAFIDSLYYSFAADCGEENEPSLQSSIIANEIPHLRVDSKRNRERFKRNVSDQWEAPLPVELLDSAIVTNCDCGINPASIQTIWNKKFNQTNLATKEFEERMPWIHRTCTNAILDLYIQNLDKNLYEVDQLAAEQLNGSLKAKFLQFAALKQGKVETSSTAQKELNAYYLIKRKALERIVKLTNDAYWQKQDSLDRAMNRQTTVANERYLSNKNQISQQELDYNTARVCRELGLQKPIPRANPLVQFDNRDVQQNRSRPTTSLQANRPVLRANISSLGWRNVDCLLSVSMNRESVAIQGNGRTTSLSYSPLNLIIQNANQFSKMNVYIVPTAFNSFIKLDNNGINYTYSLNDDLAYRTLVIAWAADGFYVYQNENTQSGTRTLVLEKMEKEAWEALTKSNLAMINGMTAEFDYLEYLKIDEKRQNSNKDKRDLKRKARPYVFPCGDLGNGANMTEITHKSMSQMGVRRFQTPDIITPNGDGLNDFFSILGEVNFSTFSIIIKDTQDRVLFKSFDPSFKWDGTDLDGISLKGGIYYLEINAIYSDGSPFILETTISIEL